MDDRYDMIVAGGGLVGLALAVALSRAFAGDFRVAVVEAGPLSPASGSSDVRASALGAGSRRMLEAIGVWDRVRDVSLDVGAVDLTDSRLTDGIRPVLLTYDTRLDGDEPAMTIVPNRDLITALRSAAAMAAGVTLIPSSRIVATTRGTTSVTVDLADGRRLHTALLAAADGRSSTQRGDAGIKTVAWPHEQVGIVTLINHELPHESRAVQHFLPGGPFALLPLPGNATCVTWSETAGEAKRLLPLSDADFLDAIDLRVGGRLGRLSLAGARQSWPLETFLARSLIADRIALIGDAARGVHPIAGQGLNLGLRDCAALAEVTADAARTGQDIGTQPILERYEQWRRADGVMSAASFDAINRLFSSDMTVLRSLRDAGLGLVDRMPALKRRLVAEAAGLTGDLPRLMRGVLP